MMEPTRVSAPLARHAMAFVLAGGRGSRLLELTETRSKPAVYFGGKSRIIDFALSNALNSGIRRIGVATQYKAHSLIRHLQRGWNFFRHERNESFDILPASQQVSENLWYAGTADAVYQNIEIIRDYGPRYIVLLAGDHVYKQDYELMLQQHVDHGRRRDRRLPRSAAHGGDRLRRHARSTRPTASSPSSKSPPTRPPMPGKPRPVALASMGIYVFEARSFCTSNCVGTRRTRRRATISARTSSPTSCKSRQGRGAPSLRALLRARLDRGGEPIGATPARSILTGRRTSISDRPGAGPRPLRPRLADLDLRRDHPAGQVRARRRGTPRPRHQLARLRRLHRLRHRAVAARCSSPACTSTPIGWIHGAVILPYAEIGRSAKLKNVIIDRGVHIPDGLVVGHDQEHDSARFRRTDKGICLITQKMIDRLTN